MHGTRSAEAVPCVGRKEIALAADSVYKMQVEESTARWASEYEGETYCFCAPGCRHVFDESPEQYVSG